jgi:hypothetical protein
MNNLLSYCGLVELRLSASEKDLPVHFSGHFDMHKCRKSAKFAIEISVFLQEIQNLMNMI